jgi:hypothetical protein
MSTTSGINVAGTTALGDFYEDEITNTAALFSGSFPAATGLASILQSADSALIAEADAKINASSATASGSTSTSGSASTATSATSTAAPATTPAPSLDPLTYAPTGEIDSEGSGLPGLATQLSSLGVGTNVNTQA